MIAAKRFQPRFSPRGRQYVLVAVAVLLVILGSAAVLVGSYGLRAPQAIELNRFWINSFSRNNAVWSADGTHIFATSRREHSMIFELADGTSHPLDADVNSTGDEYVAVSADGTVMVTAGDYVRIWDAKTQTVIRTFPANPIDGDDTNSSYQVAVNTDGTRIAVLYSWHSKRVGTISIFDTQTGQELTVVQAHTEDFPKSIALSPDGRRLATGGENKGIANVWDAATGAKLLTLHGNGNMVSDIAWSPDGRHIATANDHDRGIIWDAQTGALVRMIRVSPPLLLRSMGLRPHGNFRDWTTAVAWSPDGTLVAFGNSDATAGVWNVASGKRMLSIFGPEEDILSIDWSPDGTKLLTMSEDSTVSVWDARAAYE